MSIHLRADQVISGFAINFLALGVTGYFFIDIYGENGTPGDLPRIPDIKIGALGSVFGDLNLMIWISFLLLIVAHVTLFRTPSACAFVPSASTRARRTRSASRCTPFAMRR
jgi:simple sugar transport system permease protein